MVYTVGSKCSKNICKRTSTYRQKCGHVFLEHSVGLYTTSDYDSSRYCRSWQQIYFFILITIFYVIFIINSAVNKYVIVRYAQRPAHCAVIGYDTVRRCKKIDMSIPWSQSNRSRSRIVVVNNALKVALSIAPFVFRPIRQSECPTAPSWL